MAVRGRKKGVPNGQSAAANTDECDFCEGSGRHWGGSCGACDGTGSELVRKQMQKVYNAKNKLPLNYNLNLNVQTVSDAQ